MSSGQHENAGDSVHVFERKLRFALLEEKRKITEEKNLWTIIDVNLFREYL